MLAATILFIATNAGVIGASRITYSMATYRQLPEVFRRLHPRFKTPWLSLLVFAGIAPILVLLPGQTSTSSGRCTRSARCSRSRSPTRRSCALRGDDARRGARLPRAAEPADRRGIDWPLFAILGGLATGVAWLVVVVQNPPTRWVGLGWLVARFRRLRVYRRRVLHVPLRRPCRRRLCSGRRSRSSTGRSSCPSSQGRVARRRWTSRAGSPPSGARDRRARPCSRFRSTAARRRLPEHEASANDDARRGARDRRARTACAS